MKSSATVPQIKDLTFPTIRALKALGGSGHIDEIDDKVVELEGIPGEVQAVLQDGGKSMLRYRLSWARNYLKHAGAIEKTGQGLWALTAKGAAFSKQQGDSIVADVRRREAKEAKEAKIAEAKKAQEPLDSFSMAEDSPSNDWKVRLLEVLKNMKADAFERLAQRILRAQGFVKVDVTGKSGDGGIDGLGTLRLNLLSFKVFFQCKRYSTSVGPGAIRDFRGAMQGRCDKGLLITTGWFSPDAKKEAVRDGAHAVDLIDGDALCDILKSSGLGVAIEQIESVKIDEEWFQTI